MELLVIPTVVYKFRGFGAEHGGAWVENSYRKESMEVIFYYSKPDAFNKNDDNDCKVECDRKYLEEYMRKPVINMDIELPENYDEEHFQSKITVLKYFIDMAIQRYS